MTNQLKNRTHISKNFGFTLAEVLIVIAIIGVIALLTIPRVMKNYRNRIYAVQIKKLYGQLTEAVQASIADEGVSDFYESKSGKVNSCSDADNGICEQGAGYFLNKYFVPVKRNCSDSGEAACKAASYVSMTGTNAGGLAGEYCIQIKTKATICMGYVAGDKQSHINVDINGKDLPNVTGRDVFRMSIEPSGQITDYKNVSSENCSNPGSAGCLNKLMDASWKMNY